MGAEPPPAEFDTVADVLERKARLRGEDPFLTYGDTRVSFAELDRRANVVANNLAAEGVEPGDTVCLFCYNSLEYVSTYFALAKLGAIVAPVDTRFTGETLQAVLSRTEASTVLIDAETREAYEAVRNQVPNVTTEYFVGEGDGPHR